MPKRVEVRPLTQDEREKLEKLKRTRTAPSRMVERAKGILLLSEGKAAHDVASGLGVSQATVYHWLHRFNAEGMSGLDDRARSGRPQEYSEEERGHIIATARTHPQQLARPYAHWTLSRLVEYVNHELGIGISRAQLARVLEEEGLRWYQEETYFTERPDPQFAVKRGQ